VAWPKGVPRKTDIKLADIPVTDTPFTLSQVQQALPPIRYDLVLGIRALRNGPFKGLWELVKLTDGKREVLTDANSRGMVINIATRYIMKIVVMANAG
jgi:hypothetical protein